MPSQRLREYAETLAATHGTSGHAVAPDGRLIHSAYRDDDYDLFVDGDRLTDVDGDLTEPQWLDGRETLLALHDAGGAERHDLVEVDPETGAVTPILEDDHDSIRPLQSPTDSERVAFVSTRAGSLDVYTVRIGEGEESVTRQSTTDRMAWAFDWSPDGDRLVYQAGLTEESGLRVVDLSAGTDEPLVDLPDSEQTLNFGDGGHHAWSGAGIAFATNHATGYGELAVADPDGSYEVRFENERDKYQARWIPAEVAPGDADVEDQAIAFVEVRSGDHALRILSDGEVRTVAETGVNGDLVVGPDGLYYSHDDHTTAGDVHRDGERVVAEGTVDVPTVAPDSITYESFDGTTIPALRYDPEGDPRGAVVKAHGGPEGKHFNGLDPVTQTVVREGFTVLAPDVRGSVGYGRAFRKESDGDLGGDDLQDLVAAADHLREEDHASVGITGGSYGGYMTLMAVGATGTFDAGASVCGVVNWETVVEDARGFVGDELMRKLGGTPEERPEFYAERSPITYVDDIDVPLLVVQGANDPRVPRSEAEQIVDSLADRSIPHEYLLFEDEGHGVIRTENRIEYVERMVSFFDEHL